MSIWRGKVSIPKDGLTIHTIGRTGNQEHTRLTQEAVAIARDAITEANCVANYGYRQLGETLQSCFDYYFRLDGGSPTQEEWETFCQVLVLTRNGLHGDNLHVKITNKPVGGYVNARATKVFGFKKKPKKDWTQTTIGNKSVYMGTIHLAERAIEYAEFASNPKANVMYKYVPAITVVHEATHKYAGTNDFGEKGYTSTGLKDFGDFRKPGLTRQMAFNNAESYAQFVIYCLTSQ